MSNKAFGGLWYTMNGIDENVKVVKVMPQWQTWLIALDVVVGIVILGGAIHVTRRIKKNK